MLGTSYSPMRYLFGNVYKDIHGLTDYYGAWENLQKCSVLDSKDKEENRSLVNKKRGA